MQFNLIYFIRLFSKHISLIIGVPIVLATTVFLLTKDEPRMYSSQTTVYTSFASGSSIDLSTMKINSINTAFDNLIGTIKSRETIEDVGLKLFAEHLSLEKDDPLIILPEHYHAFINSLPAEVKKLKVSGNLKKTFENVKAYRLKKAGNFIDNLIKKGHPYYGNSSILGKLKVRRLQSSDNIELTFESNDPGICQHTLIYLTETFKDYYLLLKAGESDNAVAYYEAEVAKAAEKLRVSEEELLKFNQDNQIINYSEQSKFIAARKEAFESGYQEVLKRNSAAKAIIDLMEVKMSPYDKQKLSGMELMKLREKLASVNQELAMVKFFSNGDNETNAASNQQFQTLTQQAYDLKQQMKTAVDSLYYLTNSQEGIPSNNILNDWLTNVIDYEGTKAEITTLDQLRSDFDKIYARYAPMGATMRKLERKINVNEDEYITLLKNLGLAKLKQQGLVAASGFSVIDEPFFPATPLPSKRKVIILASAIVSFILVLFLILVIDLIDPALRNAFRTKSKTGLEIATLFPLLLPRKRTTINQQIEQQSIDILIRKIFLDTDKFVEHKRKTIALFSTRPREGKSFLINKIHQNLKKLGISSLLLVPEGSLNSDEIDNSVIEFKVDEHYITSKNINHLINSSEIEKFEESEFVLIELPGFIQHSYPVDLFKNIDICYLICRSNRSWAVYDSAIIEETLKLKTKSTLTLILNGVALDEMETLLGELPKKRSWIRKLVKGIVTHQSRTKSVV